MVVVRLYAEFQHPQESNWSRMLEGKRFLITGGTGSFGQTLVERLKSTNISEIVVFSRDETKQHYMQQQQNYDPRIRFIVGDIRNYESILKALRGIDYVFHAAALKQVPTSESFPWEFIQTNVLGSHNLLNAIVHSNVAKAIFLSTDKAVYPLNSMGMTKALMEKLVRSGDYKPPGAAVITRYGNVIGSRGSVIPQFVNSIIETKSVSVTSLEMTRFMMTLEESVDLVLFALNAGKDGDLFVQKSPSATVETIIEALKLLLDVKKIEIHKIGIRPGEKIHETLLTSEEMSLAIEHDRFFQVCKRSSTEKTSSASATSRGDYSSDKTKLLNANELAELLHRVPGLLQGR
jgi:UDP-N-acetylglucosamine 4,6-dehydratase